MRDFPASSVFAALLDRRYQASSRGSRCKKLRLTRAESKTRSMAGMQRRDEVNRANGAAFIAENPQRAAEYARRKAEEKS